MPSDWRWNELCCIFDLKPIRGATLKTADKLLYHSLLGLASSHVVFGLFDGGGRFSSQGSKPVRNTPILHFRR
jgi:hypothetical protein